MLTTTQTLKEYEYTLLKRRTKLGIQINLILSDGSGLVAEVRCCVTVSESIGPADQ
ncbi:hypothetical protein OI978_06045 [Serratia nevei]|uniref:hypothetical protein n=1 Tax=Serratia nevei TaxID=2703794 RepID=UPI002543C010|nr:hypothetical protein [Serratia nevei]EMB4112150.1 hypothetical protein [Serratia marcescens]WIJ65529.1 hypothetical protein OI978_06045 [Serratia nevei]